MISELIARDVRRGFTGAAWLPIAFFLLVATLMPFAIGPDARLLSAIGSGALWIAALTAALLPIERLVEPDRADGVLDQLFLHGVVEESIAATKIVAHWLKTLGCGSREVEAAREEALQWSLQRGSRSGRVAYQFARDWAGKHAKKK